MGIPLVPVEQLEAAVAVKRTRLMTEEVAELIVAMDQEELVEVADACCDLIYVVAGTAVAYGFSELPHRSFPDSNYMKLGLVDRPSVLGLSGILVERLTLTLYAIALPTSHEYVKNQLESFIEAVYRIATAYNIPLDECFMEVHRSNMTKTALNEFAKGGKGEGYTPPQLAKLLHGPTVKQL